jgi:hypothetical protein
MAVVAAGENRYTGTFAREAKRRPLQVLAREGIKAAIPEIFV